MGITISGDNFDPYQLAKDIKDQTLHEPFETECPNCHQKVQVKLGHNNCPYCGSSIDVTKGSGWD